MKGVKATSLEPKCTKTSYLLRSRWRSLADWRKAFLFPQLFLSFTGQTNLPLNWSLLLVPSEQTHNSSN